MSQFQPSKCPRQTPRVNPPLRSALTNLFSELLHHYVTIGSPIVQIYSQVADLGSACKLAPQSPGLPQTERLSMRVLKLILKLREVSPLALQVYTASRKGTVPKLKST